jgi:hypothetical protein
MRRSFLYFFLGIIVGVVLIIGGKKIYKRYRDSINNLHLVQLLRREDAYAENEAKKNKPTLAPNPEAYKEYQGFADKPTLRVKTINFDPGDRPENVRVDIIHEVLAEKYNLVYDKDNYDILLNSFFQNDYIPDPSPNVVRIYYTGEVFLGDPRPYLPTNDIVIGFDFLEEEHSNYLRIPFSYLRDSDKMRHDYKREGKCDPSAKPFFACFLVSNSGVWFPGKFDGATARDRIFYRLSLYKTVMSGAKHLNNIGGIVPYGETQKWLSQCKFIISYENTLNYPGYVTEKPFQSWFAGGVPIYNTHRSGLEDLNPKSLLYAGDFDTEEEFVEYIKKVDNDDKLYCDIWNQQIINDPSKDYSAMKDKLRKKLYEVIEKKLGK